MTFSFRSSSEAASFGHVTPDKDRYRYLPDSTRGLQVSNARKSVDKLSSFHVLASSNRARSFFSAPLYASLLPSKSLQRWILLPSQTNDCFEQPFSDRPAAFHCSHAETWRSRQLIESYSGRPSLKPALQNFPQSRCESHLVQQW